MSSLQVTAPRGTLLLDVLTIGFGAFERSPDGTVAVEPTRRPWSDDPASLLAVLRAGGEHARR